MASATHVYIDPQNRPWGGTQFLSPDSAKKTSDILQENERNHHAFFNSDHFHNHIVHHVLAVYALGASPAAIQQAYDTNKGYQRPRNPRNTSSLEDMRDPAKFRSLLGAKSDPLYNDFLVFFQEKIEQDGWHNVVNEFLFKGDEAADDFLVRTFAGFMHPLIHLGYGVEFRQPALIAEALAQAALHDSDGLLSFYTQVEKRAAEKRQQGGPSKSLVEILNELSSDPDIKGALNWDDKGNRLKALIERQGDRLVELLSQYWVDPEELSDKTVEMINTAVYFTAAAQNPDKAVKFDFFYMHCANSSIFFSSFVQQGWMSPANKARLLAYKGWTDLALYASRNSATLRPEDIRNYQPEHPTKSQDVMSPAAWQPLVDKATAIEDDGHTPKLLRAIMHASTISMNYEKDDRCPIKYDMWLKLGHMAMDSVDRPDEPRWIRSTGFPEAWESVRPRASL